MSRRSSALVSRRGRPGDVRTASPASPNRRRAFRQSMTELAAHPTRRPTSLSENPSSTSRSARRRRSSKKSAEPRSRIGTSLPEIHHIVFFMHISIKRGAARANAPFVAHGTSHADRANRVKCGAASWKAAVHRALCDLVRKRGRAGPLWARRHSAEHRGCSNCAPSEVA
jgi:hypothetical protein